MEQGLSTVEPLRPECTVTQTPCRGRADLWTINKNMEKLRDFTEWLNESTAEDAADTVQLWRYGIVPSYSRIDFSLTDRGSINYMDNEMGRISFNLAWPNPDSAYDYTLYTTSFSDPDRAREVRSKYYYGDIGLLAYAEWVWAHIVEPVEKYAPGATAADFKVVVCSDTGDARTIGGEPIDLG